MPNTLKLLQPCLSGMDPGVELRHLRYFVVVAELNNVSRAAQKLRVAQPALSRQIRDLEEELGVSLLQRSSRGVMLTEAGRVFAKEAREILSHVETAVDSVRSTARGESGELHLGYAPSPTVELLPRVLHAFQNAVPGVRIVLHDNSTGEMLKNLKNGSLDVALMVRPSPESLEGLVFERMESYPICVAMGLSHRMARRSSVDLRRLLDEKLVVYRRSEYGEYHALLEELFAPLGRSPQIATECDSAPSLIAAVEAGHGVAIVPRVLRCLSGGRVKIRTLVPAPAPLEVGFAHVPEPSRPATTRLIRTLRSLRHPDRTRSVGVR